MWHNLSLDLIVLNNSHSISHIRDDSPVYGVSHNQETYTMEKSKMICDGDELRFNHLDPNIECITYDQMFELKLIMFFKNFENYVTK
jgi:hypothetical protein